MDVKFERADEQHIRAMIVYGKTADHKLYYEAGYKTQVSKTDAENAFAKGMLQIVDSTTTLIPIAMTGTTVKTVGGTTTAATLVEWTVAAG